MSFSARRRPLASAVLRLLLAVGLLVPLSAVALPSAAATSPQSVPALSDAPLSRAITGSDFTPGNIISDALFYDRTAMSAGEIQRFLDARIGSCANGKCLNVATIDFPAKPISISPDTGATKCEPVAGGVISVAELIYRVQVACNISARVILVTLQKEQGLVTNKSPSDRSLTYAMGMACSDTAPCDSAFAGLGTQIYTGARQLNTYKVGRFGKQPGSNYIQYHPNGGCGGTTINITNYATAALYNYTPYQPNAASLANLGGTGDGCSSYGNRNFWAYYTNWFGSTQDMTEALWLASGGATGPIGEATGDLECSSATACYRDFANGRIYWSKAGGAHFVPTASVAALKDRSWLGYATSAHLCGLVEGGCYQVFQSGVLYTSEAGVWPVRSGFLQAWSKSGKEWGPAGYPRSAEISIAGGTRQDFENGSYYWGPSTGVRYVPASADAARRANAWLGMPTSSYLCGLRDDGCYQLFQNGSLYGSAGGTWTVRSGFLTAWSRSGKEWGGAGYPLSDEFEVPGGTSQQFERGRYYWSATTGVHFVPKSSEASVLASPWLGFPTSGRICGLPEGGCYQSFRNGVLYSSTVGVWPVQGGFLREWTRLGKEWGSAGYPASGELPAAGGTYQEFQHGRFYWSPTTGARFVPGPILAAYIEAGGESGTYGYPVGDARGTASTISQNFQRGTLTVDR
jgi:uncharacterized protein with LGFP repeats